MRERNDIVGSSTGPDFIVMGQQRSATRWLYDQLRNSDKFWMPPIKELNYFDGRVFRSSAYRRKMAKFKNDDRYRSRIPTSDKDFLNALLGIDKKKVVDDQTYLSFFSAKGDRISGDISPKYEMLDLTKIGSIYKLIPNVKIIYLIRNPVDRFESAIKLYIKKGRLSSAALNDVSILSSFMRKPRITERSSPTKTWERWGSVFPASATKFWFFDDIVERPDTVRTEIAEFLGVSDAKFFKNGNFNRKSKKSEAMSASVKKHIRSLFDDEIRQCAEMFGSHARNW
jgi:hypothetical protein